MTLAVGARRPARRQVGPQRADLPGDRRARLAMLAPLCTVLFVVAAFPTLYSLYVSFTNLQIGTPHTGKFVGVGNFTGFLGNQLTRSSLEQTGIFLVVGLAAELVLGILIARLFAAVADVRGMQLLRTLYLLPVMVTSLLVGLLWSLILDPSVGIVDYLLGQVGLPQPALLGSPSSAFWVVLALEVWQWLPLAAMVIYAGMLSIPEEVREASRIDGAGALRQLLSIELPMVKRLVAVAMMLEGIQLIGAFSLVYSATHGGPGTTTTVSSYAIFKEGFVFFQTGQAAAGALIVLVVTVVIAQVFARMVFKEEP